MSTILSSLLEPLHCNRWGGLNTTPKTVNHVNTSIFQPFGSMDGRQGTSRSFRTPSVAQVSKARPEKKMPDLNDLANM